MGHTLQEDDEYQHSLPISASQKILSIDLKKKEIGIYHELLLN